MAVLAPKRHQHKHLDFDLLHFGTRGSEVQILFPRPFINNLRHYAEAEAPQTPTAYSCSLLRSSRLLSIKPDP